MVSLRRVVVGLPALLWLGATFSCGSEAAPPSAESELDAAVQSPPPPVDASVPDAAPPPPAIQIALAVAPSSVVLAAGDKNPVPVALSISGNQGRPVDLGIDNLPLGVSAFIDPLVSTGSATVTFSTSADAPSGKFAASVRAQTGSAVARAAVAIEVVAAGPSFDAALAPSSVAATPGDVVGFAISVVRRGGFDGPLTVSAPALPTGFEADGFTIPSGATSGVLNVRTNPLLAPETSASFEIHVASDTLGTKKLQASLTVSPRSGTLDVSFGQAGSTYQTTRIPHLIEPVAHLDEQGNIALLGAVDDTGVEHSFGVTKLSSEGAFSWSRWTSFTNEHGVVLEGTGRAIAPISGASHQYAVVGEPNLPSSVALAAFGGPSASAPVVRTQPICNSGPPLARAVFVEPQTSLSPWSATVVGSCGITQLSRWRSDGTLDPTFGTNGVTTIDEPSFDIRAGTHDDTFVAGRKSGGNLTVTRVGGNGSVVPSYGAGGTVDTGVPVDDVYAVDVDDSHHVLVVVGTGNVVKLVHLTPAGALDAAFGTGGVTSLGLTSARSVTRANGRILVAGSLPGYGVAVAGVLGNGQVDGAFGLGGVAIIRSAPAFPLAVRGIGGRIVVVSKDGGGVYVSKLWE